MARRFAFSPGRVLALLAALSAASCGDSNPVAPEPSVQFLVGDWEAVRFEIIPDFAPEQSIDLVAEGGTFTLNVQPSGTYTAVLSLAGVGTSPEIGTLRVEGDELIFTRTNPPPTTESRADLEILSQDRVTFSGGSSLDITGDGVRDPVTLDVEIVRQ